MEKLAEKLVDEKHGEYFDMFIGDAVVFVNCPECLKDSGVSLINKTVVNAEGGYWAAKFFHLDFSCPFCMKDVQVKIKKRKRSKIHGAYVLDKSDFDVGNGVKISRERYYANKYVPDQSIMSSAERVSLVNKFHRFSINTNKFKEEIDWYLESHNMSMEEVYVYMIESLRAIIKDPMDFFGTFHQREYPAFLKELGNPIEEVLEAYEIILASLRALRLENSDLVLGGSNV